MGAAAVSAGAALVKAQDKATCPEIPYDTFARIRIIFPKDSDGFVKDFIQGKRDWKRFESEIVNGYNNASQGCDETYQREMIDCPFVFHELNIEDQEWVDTYWRCLVLCNSSCPIEDPLFGIDVPDPVDRILQAFDPTIQPTRPGKSASSNHVEPQERFMEVKGSQSDEVTESPSSSPTIRPKVPVSRMRFLDHIGALSVEPSTRTVFEYPTIVPSDLPSLTPSVEPSAMLLSEESSVPSMVPSHLQSGLPTEVFEASVVVFGQVSMEQVEQSFIEATLSILENSMPSRLTFQKVKQYLGSRRFEGVVEKFDITVKATSTDCDKKVKITHVLM